MIWPSSTAAEVHAAGPVSIPTATHRRSMELRRRESEEATLFLSSEALDPLSLVESPAPGRLPTPRWGQKISSAEYTPGRLCTNYTVLFTESGAGSISGLVRDG